MKLKLLILNVTSFANGKRGASLRYWSASGWRELPAGATATLA